MLESSSNLVQVVHDIAGSLSKKAELQSFLHSSAEKIAESKKDWLLSFTFPVEQLDPLYLLGILHEQGQSRFYWEKKDSALTVTGCNSILSLQNEGEKRFAAMRDKIAGWQASTLEYSETGSPLSGLHFFGGFSFFEEVKTDPWISFGSAHLFVPQWCFIHSGEEHLMILTLRAAPGTSESCLYNLLEEQILRISEKLEDADWTDTGEHPLHYKKIVNPNDREHWHETILDATDRIRNRQFKKIVLARKMEVEAERPFRLITALQWLRTTYPNCFCFLFQPENGSAFVGCSPERLASFQSRFVLTEALAGSISRGATAEEDGKYEKKLQTSEKDQEEHRYVVEAIEKRLHHLTSQIDYPPEPGIRKFENVQHLYTPVTAWIDGEIDIMTLLGALHPTPAVGGFPYEKTKQLIRDMEPFERGWYAAPVGWCNSRGRGEFAVAIRSGLINENKAELYAGCGIVEQSNPDAEWDETNLKFMPMLSALKHA